MLTKNHNMFYRSSGSQIQRLDWIIAHLSHLHTTKCWINHNMKVIPSRVSNAFLNSFSGQWKRVPAVIIQVNHVVWQLYRCETTTDTPCLLFIMHLDYVILARWFLMKPKSTRTLFTVNTVEWQHQNFTILEEDAIERHLNGKTHQEFHQWFLNICQRNQRL